MAACDVGRVPRRRRAAVLGYGYRVGPVDVRPHAIHRVLGAFQFADLLARCYLGEGPPIKARRKGRFPAPDMFLRCRRSIVFLLVRVGERLRRSSRVRIRQPTGRPYKHHDLGVAVDLTARNAVATVLGIRLSGRLAKLVGRTYHLRALPARAAASAFRRSQCRHQRRADRRDRPGRVALRNHPRQSQRRPLSPRPT